MTRQKTWSLGILAAFGLLLAAPMARANTIAVDIPNDPTYSWTWAEDLTLGYTFTVSTSLTFNALAVFDVISATVGAGTPHTNALGLNASHLVGVWDSLGNLLVSATVDPTDPTTASTSTYGSWVYQTIASTTLGAGSYTIGAFYAGNSDPVMVQQSATISVPGVSYTAGRYVYSSLFQRPTGAYAPNEKQYFGPTMLSVPDGGMTFSLLGAALVGLAVLRRKLHG